MSEVNVHANRETREPDISIIVPAYNAELWITETLRSIVDQTIDPGSYEIIVVDNESQDRTLDVAEAALRNVSTRVMLSSEPKKGPAHARNHGLQLARGNWIQFLDADDLLHPDKLRRQLTVAQTCGVDTGLIYSAWQSLELSRTGWTKGPPLVPEFDDRSLSARLSSLLDTAGFFQIGSSLFRRDAVLSVGGYMDVGLIEDVDLYIRLAIAAWSFVHCSSLEPLFSYRRHHDGSLSNLSTVAFADGVVRNAALVESWARSHQILDQPLSSQLIACYFQAARTFAGRDWLRFDAVVERIQKIGGVVIPPSPWALTILSQLIGYKAAERTALWWRQFKKFARVG
jgi:glycosyltransferase involved in cell wall biosynthesis